MIATAKMFIATAIPGRPYLPGERRPAPAQPRQVVSAPELVTAVNRELALRHECDGLEVEAAPTLRPGYPDADGCNWNAAGLRVRIAHGASTRALGCVRQVVEWARLNLELAPDSGPGLIS